jgi:hypothetical protein
VHLEWRTDGRTYATYSSFCRTEPNHSCTFSHHGRRCHSS